MRHMRGHESQNETRIAASRVFSKVVEAAGENQINLMRKSRVVAALVRVIGEFSHNGKKVFGYLLLRFK